MHARISKLSELADSEHALTARLATATADDNHTYIQTLSSRTQVRTLTRKCAQTHKARSHMHKNLPTVSVRLLAIAAAADSQVRSYTNMHIYAHTIKSLILTHVYNFAFAFDFAFKLVFL